MSLPPFEQVVTQHGTLVWRVCRALLPETDAEDAWAETFLAALRAYPDLRADSHLPGWLSTIAHRKAIDILRAAGRRALPVAEVPERSTAAPIGGTDPDLLAALEQLTDKQRTAVLLHHVGGLPYADVAADLGSTEAAARRSAADGIAKLRRLLPEGGLP